MKGSPMARNYGAPFKDNHHPPLVLEAMAKRAAAGKETVTGDPGTMSDAEVKAWNSENKKKVEAKTGKKFSSNYINNNYDSELPLISDAARKRDQVTQNAYDEMMDKE